MSRYSQDLRVGNQIASLMDEAESESCDKSAVSRLESQLSGKTPSKSGSYRWRPFQQKRQTSQPLEDLPDSPAVTTIEQRGNKSSELAKTLSRMSSRVMR